MPVYNGERYLADSLRALLAQDYPHFELIISDNASTDGTEKICREFKKTDSRIRYIPHLQNRGATWNFASVVHQASGKYFMWAAHDDSRAPSFISKCLSKLESHPRAMLCCTEINFVDADGLPDQEWTKKKFENLDTDGMSPVERVHELIARCGWFAIYGLMRLEDTRKLSLGLSVQGWDVIFLMELMMKGNFIKVREPLFSYRIAQKKKSTADYQEEMNSEGQTAAATTTPFTDLAVNLIRTVYGSQLSDANKSAIFADFISTITFLNDYWRQQITSELVATDLRMENSRFAALLNLVLSRGVPCESFKKNPLLEIFFANASGQSHLLQLAQSVALSTGR
ncbi:MAG TPA: glycosyltransferase family 2 protein [Candidatus Acidoferrales bacterium]|jgi:glycosyltransferase involved in cell wall biosynthesis|nr:glycosyltransferase family 2 protein [Candidatus Acidoferrales bacterium]